MEKEAAGFTPSELNPGDKEQKKSRRKKRPGRFNAPLPISEKPTENESQDRPKFLDEAVADLLLQNERKKAEHETKEKAANDEEATVEFEGLKPHQLYGGEVVIDLENDLDEHTIPLDGRVPEIGPADRQARVVRPESVEPPARPGYPSNTNAPAEAVTPEKVEEVPEAPQSAAGGGEKPPAEPPEAPPVADSPEPPERLVPIVPPVEIIERQLHPELMQQLQQAGVNPNVAPTDQPATRQEVRDAMYAAEKAGQTRGVVTGLIVGAGYEHFKHKRREKKQAKDFRTQQKELKSVESNQNYLQQEFERHEQADARDFNRVDRAFEQKRLQPSPEAMSRPNPEVIPQPPVEVAADQVKLPEGHRLESSAWHHIEVDAKTGKAVDDPTLEYGHEYYRERHPEAAPHEQTTKEAAGEVALVAAAMQKTANESSQPMLPEIPNATTHQKVGPASIPEKAVKTTKRSSQAAGPLWPYFVILFAIIIALIFLLR